MKTRICALLFSGLVVCSTPVVAADDLCKRLRTFELSKPEHASERRWFEYHWGFDSGAIWSWGCRHSKDESAIATCRWLLDHTSRELSMMLPHSIMACYGYRFPRSAFYDWASMTGTIKLRGRHGNRLIMDMNYRDLPNGEVAVRVALEAPDQRYEPEDLPPIEPFPKAAEDKPSTAH
jgi:hypothetical protein